MQGPPTFYRPKSPIQGISWIHIYESDHRTHMNIVYLNVTQPSGQVIAGSADDLSWFAAIGSAPVCHMEPSISNLSEGRIAGPSRPKDHLTFMS